MFIIMKERMVLEPQSRNWATPVVSKFVCYICSSDRIITDHESGEAVCSKCGLVISDKFQESQVEGCTPFATDTTNVKNSTGYDSGFSTIIGRPNRDASGHILDAAMRYKMERLRRWDLRIKARKCRDENLKDALNQLQLLKDKLGLPEAIVHKATYIYRKAQVSGFVRGRTVPAVLGASVYIACRELGIPKTLKEIAGTNNIKLKTLEKIYRRLITELEIEIPTVDLTKCVITVSNKANLSEKTKRKAIDIMRHVNRNEMIDGKDPMGIAAAILYVVCQNTGEKRSQPHIAQAAGITEMTLRNRYKDIKRLDLDLTPYLITKKTNAECR
jgi:transcription initiation factor TFIIB